MTANTYLLIFTESAPDGVLMTTGEYDQWMKICSAEEFDSHFFVEVESEYVSEVDSILRGEK